MDAKGRQNSTSVLVLFCSSKRSVNSIEAKASRVIIFKFPVKLPFPVHSGLQRASKSRHVHSNGVLYGRRAFHHLSMCQYVFALYASYSVLGLRSVMATALNSDERLHSEVSLKQEQSNVRTRREDVEERGEQLQQRTPRKRQLRTVESADDRLERLQRRRKRERQLRTGDRESADGRLTSATDETTPALSEYHRVSRWQAIERLQRRRQREGQTEICQRTLSPCFQLCQKKHWFSRKTFVWMRQAGYSTSRDLPSTKVLC